MECGHNYKTLRDINASNVEIAMNESREELILQFVILNMVSYATLTWAGVGYFTTFLPFDAPINALIAGLLGGILFGIVPALAFWKWQIQKIR